MFKDNSETTIKEIFSFSTYVGAKFESEQDCWNALQYLDIGKVKPEYAYECSNQWFNTKKFPDYEVRFFNHLDNEDLKRPNLLIPNIKHNTNSQTMDKAIPNIQTASSNNLNTEEQESDG
eukprot:UN32512